jgi:hypothetical protein
MCAPSRSLDTALARYTARLHSDTLTLCSPARSCRAKQRQHAHALLPVLSRVCRSLAAVFRGEKVCNQRGRKRPNLCPHVSRLTRDGRRTALGTAHDLAGPLGGAFCFSLTAKLPFTGSLVLHSGFSTLPSPRRLSHKHSTHTRVYSHRRDSTNTAHRSHSGSVHRLRSVRVPLGRSKSVCPRQLARCRDVDRCQTKHVAPPAASITLPGILEMRPTHALRLRDPAMIRATAGT